MVWVWVKASTAKTTKHAAQTKMNKLIPLRILPPNDYPQSEQSENEKNYYII
jgi:hypothetical protein